MLQAPRQKQPQISPIFISDKRRHPDRAQRRHRARRWRWHHRKLARNVSVYGDASYLTSVSGESRITLKGNVGARVTW